MNRSELLERNLHQIGSIGGRLMSGAVAAAHVVERMRSAPARDVLLAGTIRRTAVGPTPSGLDWIDAGPAGAVQRVEARLSEVLATPGVVPDVLALKVRVFDRDRAGDLVLTSSRRGAGRLAPAPCQSLSDAWFSSVMPYQGSSGAVLIGAHSRSPRPLRSDLHTLSEVLRIEPWRLEMYWATPLGRWHRFAVLRLAPADGAAEASRFDAAHHPLSTSDAYGWAGSAAAAR